MLAHDMTDLSADEIAAELERERAELAGSIDGLRERMSANALLSDAVSYAKSNVGPYAQALDSAVRANPMAAVMLGVGVAWLVFGRKSGSAGTETTPLAGTKYEALSRWEDEGGPVKPLPDPDGAWIVQADGLRNDASAALARIDAAARAKLRPVAETARDRALVLADLAKATRAVMLRGMESLSVDAQDRVLVLREKAYAARIAAARQGTRLIEERPIVAGAIGMAIGAAVGAALPKTAMEDRLFGDERDRLLDRAGEALRQERARASASASRLANAVADEVRAGARNLVTEAL